MLPEVFQQYHSAAAPPPPTGCVVNWLGVLTLRERYDAQLSEKLEYFSPFADANLLAAGIEVNEELFEWQDALESIEEASDSYTFIEAGAGWGRWTTNVEFAIRQRRPGLRRKLVAIEAEPEHYRFLLEHLDRNGVANAATVLPIHAALCGHDGSVKFFTGRADQWYGQCIGGESIVPSISLRSLLQRVGPVDLLDMDVQGAELEALSSAPDAIDACVRRVHVGTHSHEIEARLRELFGLLGWTCLHDYPCWGVSATPHGPIAFQDGVQTWLNGRRAR